MSQLFRMSRNILRPYNFTRTQRQLFYRERRGQAHSTKNPKTQGSQEITPLKEIVSQIAKVVLMSTVSYQVTQFLWTEMALTEAKLTLIARIEKIEETLKELMTAEHSMSTTTRNSKSNE